MTQIHLHAEPGDYAPVVLLPGDPNRATRIAERFDGGVAASRLVNENRGNASNRVIYILVIVRSSFCLVTP